MRFEPDLCYCNPAHGGWGIIRVAALIPDSYLLFVCPSACFRHGALGAIQHSYKDRISYLYLDESDIVEGYDRIILSGVDELLERTDKNIRLLFIFVSCLDDLIGTDLDKITAILGDRYPKISFRGARMNPIAASTKLPPVVTTFDSMMSVLPASEKFDNGITLWGNFVKIPEDNELLRELKRYGHEVRQLPCCRSYEDYLRMSSSGKAIVIKPYVNYALTRLEKRTGSTHTSFLISYDIDEIIEGYLKLSDYLGEDLSEGIVSDIKITEGTVRKTAARIKDLPVYVSDSATLFPFKLADCLIRYGFNVRRIYVSDINGIDAPYADNIISGYPDIKIIRADGPDAVERSREREDALAIGEEAAYLSNASYVADISSDEGMFGLQGICILMDSMYEAVDHVADIKKLIEEYGGIV